MLTGPDSYLTKSCNSPVDLPNRALTQKEIEEYWSTDRASLVVCKNTKNGLIEFYVERDNGLTNG